jgi:hypothetical protein
LNPGFAVIVPVGPGPLQAERLLDLLDSLRHYEPEAAFHLYLLDDEADLRSGLAPVRGTQPFTVVPNPRKGLGNGWAGGLSVGMLTMYKRVLDDRVPFEFVLRLDTDALVIAPFAQRIREVFHQSPCPGVIGSVRYLREPEQVRRDTVAVGRALDKLSRPLTLWRRTPVGPPLLQAALLPGSRLIRKVILQARSRGYRVGEQCCGGAFALPFSTLETLAIAGFLQRPMAWLRTPLTDDFVLALMVKACGLEIRDCSDPGQPFAVRYQGLPDTPGKLAQAGHALIHSVKDHAHLKEHLVREFFRQRRHHA